MFARNDRVLDAPADAPAAASGAELAYAGFWARLAALIVDNMVITLAGIALMVGAASVAAEAAGLAVVVYVVLALLYWPVMECSARQATFGKQLVGIQVIDTYGGRLPFVRSLLRNLAKILSALPLYIGFLLAAFTPRKQALHDIITNCLVVRTGPSHFLKAAVAAAGGVVITAGAGYFYVTEVFLPQMAGGVSASMDQAMRQAQSNMQVEVKPMSEAQVAEFKKKMEQARRESANAAVAAPLPADSKPAPKAAAGAPAQPAAAPGVSVAAATPRAFASIAAPKAAVKPSSAPAAKDAGSSVRRAAAPQTISTALVAKPPAERARPARPPALADAETPARVAVPRAVAPAPRHNDVMSAVMFRDQAGVVHLLDMGWWADRPDSNGVTPLMAAAMNGDVAMAELLLKRGADPTRRGPAGSVLDYAARGGELKVIELLRRRGAR